jgi:hypothetical protein
MLSAPCAESSVQSGLCVSFKDFNATIVENTPNFLACPKKNSSSLLANDDRQNKGSPGKKFDINIVLSRQV